MIYFGADEVKKGWERYFDLCNALEVKNEASADADPTIATLNGWRTKSPKGFSFVIHADRAMGPLLEKAYEADLKVLTPAFDEIWNRTLERANALSAKAILIETSADFRPSESARKLIADLGKKTASQKRPVIWERHGLWSIEESISLAKKNNLVPCYDPFLAYSEGLPRQKGNDICFRINERAASRRQFDEYDFEKLIQWCEPFNRAFVLFNGRHKTLHTKIMSLILREI